MYSFAIMTSHTVVSIVEFFRTKTRNTTALSSGQCRGITIKLITLYMMYRRVSLKVFFLPGITLANVIK